MAVTQNCIGASGFLPSPGKRSPWAKAHHAALQAILKISDMQAGKPTSNEALGQCWVRAYQWWQWFPIHAKMTPKGGLESVSSPGLPPLAAANKPRQCTSRGAWGAGTRKTWLGWSVPKTALRQVHKQRKFASWWGSFSAWYGDWVGWREQFPHYLPACLKLGGD